MRLAFVATLAVVLNVGVQAGELGAPIKMMRALQGLEDRIATGDTIAQAAHSKAVLRLGQNFAALPLETWRDLRNARALAAYLFSGGDVGAIARAIPVEAVNKEAAALYRGAMAYASGDDETARAALLAIDAKSLPAGLAGHLALVQAALAEPTDRAKAIAALDLARLLEPGTLVEEAALRKEMALVAAAGDFDKLALLERRYQAAFSRSVYVENYKSLVASLAAREAESNAVAGNERLVRLMSPLPHADRLRLYLLIARRETLAGHLQSAPFAASEAAKLAEKGGNDAARADLYFGASAFVGGDYDRAAAALAAASPEKLDDRDQILLVAARDMAATMRAREKGSDATAVAADDAVLKRGEASLDVAAAAVRSATK